MSGERGHEENPLARVPGAGLRSGEGEDHKVGTNGRLPGLRRPLGFQVPLTRPVSDSQVEVSSVDDNAREIAFVNSVFARLNSVDGGSNVTRGAGVAKKFPEL